MFRLIVTAIACLFLIFPTIAFSHGGGLDSQGGHNDRKNGGYHFHRKVSQPKEKPAAVSNKQIQKESGTVNFHGNTESRVFHDPSCRYFNCNNCIATFTTREQAIDAGYRPCKKCSS